MGDPLYSQYPGILDDFPQGTTVPVVFTFNDSAGDPIDVTGYTMSIVLSLKRGFSPIALTVNIVIGSAINGIMEGELSVANTTALDAGNYYYIIKYTKPDGKAYVIDMGKVTVITGV